MVQTDARRGSPFGRSRTLIDDTARGWRCPGYGAKGPGECEPPGGVTWRLLRDEATPDPSSSYIGTRQMAVQAGRHLAVVGEGQPR